ncbi:MAG: hypothetical protein NT079_02035, partial [Candidatus Omnitrophica bacterium]|nr:hypothetical protein [Candidatus Omnitrophota bacterium]
MSNLSLAVLLGLSFGVCICLVHLLKDFVNLNYYESSSFAFSFLASILVMAPAGLLTGYAFSQFSQNYLSEHDGEKNARPVREPTSSSAASANGTLKLSAPLLQAKKFLLAQFSNGVKAAGLFFAYEAAGFFIAGLAFAFIFST